MGQKTDTRTIAGMEVTTTQLPALRAFALLNKLGRILAPALAKAADLKVSTDMDVSALAPALGELFANLHPEESGQLAKEILAYTSVIHNGAKIDLGSANMIDHVFTGEFKGFLMTMLFAIQVNFSDFFDGGPLGNLGDESPDKPSSSPSPKK